jgi:hypothetical protein
MMGSCATCQLPVVRPHALTPVSFLFYREIASPGAQGHRPRKTPNPESSGFSATCPLLDRRLRSFRGIASRDSSRCRTLTSSNPECRNPEVRWTLILHACGRGYLSRNSSSIGRSSELRRTSRGSPTVDSLSPEEVSSAPPSFCVASTGVDFRSKQKNYLS